MFQLINKTRIFISSAYENDLKEPRKIIKKQLEENGHEVPIFEDGDFGTWEKDTLKQCLDVVSVCDIFVLLINNKSGASSRLLDGNVTPTYLEYKAALQHNKHILVFVSPFVKHNFTLLRKEFDKLYKTYQETHHRIPNSPFDPLSEWINSELSQEGTFKDLLALTDPFVWAFLYEVYRNGNWVYDFNVARAEEQAKNISSMLSTTLRSVVGLVSEREQIEELKGQASYLLAYADYTLQLLEIRNDVSENGVETWSYFLEQGTRFLRGPLEIIQARDINPMAVNSSNGCFAASLYTIDKDSDRMLSLVGSTDAIDPDHFYNLDEKDVYVVEAYNNQVRLITFREEKQMLYVTEPLGNFVLCLHFKLNVPWNVNQVKAYEDEIQYAIIDQHEYFFDYFKGLILGG
ncbi:hypothetical protein JCM9140_3766 [Halalkalibacter wakoensis JCM 9140]|uniref:DUF4062 domain-containing protein n=1 Tax=Halalkalibacter wakoensis JCM 9140 TaxID=1236970 RepID=W4Q7E0_9BACI|nr:DUF4062 domain-containing protein [Halalkalibacter wakoensis]GAE27613.1 hypothetical protein JCM9140_3766 [Halalkalibacter wakoensis JCM 9140]